MTLARLLCVCALTLVVPLHAQQPTVEASAVAMRAQPLPVLDHDGQVISEDLIRATMRDRGGRRVLYVLVSAIAGSAVFAALTRPDHDCSIYDPCTPQEKYYRDHAPLVGLFVGSLVGAMIPNYSVDRARAVEILRERRRAARALGTP